MHSWTDSSLAILILFFIGIVYIWTLARTRILPGLSQGFIKMLLCCY